MFNKIKGFVALNLFGEFKSLSRRHIRKARYESNGLFAFWYSKATKGFSVKPVISVQVFIFPSKKNKDPLQVLIFILFCKCTTQAIITIFAWKKDLTNLSLINQLKALALSYWTNEVISVLWIFINLWKKDNLHV